MKASLLDLRLNPDHILASVKKGETVILSRRGNPIARITPLMDEASGNLQSHEAFGMWKGRDEDGVETQVRTLRKGRF